MYASHEQEHLKMRLQKIQQWQYHFHAERISSVKQLSLIFNPTKSRVQKLDSIYSRGYISFQELEWRRRMFEPRPCDMSIQRYCKILVYKEC
jgi:hypothetical protein